MGAITKRKNHYWFQTFLHARIQHSLVLIVACTILLCCYSYTSYLLLETPQQETGRLQQAANHDLPQRRRRRRQQQQYESYPSSLESNRTFLLLRNSNNQIPDKGDDDILFSQKTTTKNNNNEHSIIAALGINSNDVMSSKTDIDAMNESTVSQSSVVGEQQTTADKATDKDKKKKHLNFIIHMGPSKTGTTTLQKYCSKFQRDLAKDNYIYLGRYSNKRSKIHLNLLSGSCFAKLQESRNRSRAALLEKNNTAFLEANNEPAERNVPDSCWDSMIQELKQLYHQNKNVILSNEAYSYNSEWIDPFGIYNNSNNYSADYFKEFARALTDWNVIIVVGYRRYGEWLLSTIKQDDTIKCSGTFTERKKQNGWPHQGGIPCMKKWPRIQFPMNRLDYTGTLRYRYIDNTLSIWNSHGFSTRIVNNHLPERDIRTIFFCDILDNAPHMCHMTIKNNITLQKTTDNKLSAATSSYSNIVFAAAQRGWLKENVTKTTTREKAAKELQWYHEQTLQRSFLDLPLLCPTNDELGRLLNRSLTLEQTILPEFFQTPHGKDAHRSSFFQNGLGAQRVLYCRYKDIVSKCNVVGTSFGGNEYNCDLEAIVKRKYAWIISGT